MPSTNTIWIRLPPADPRLWCVSRSLTNLTQLNNVSGEQRAFRLSQHLTSYMLAHIYPLRMLLGVFLAPPTRWEAVLHSRLDCLFRYLKNSDYFLLECRCSVSVRLWILALQIESPCLPTPLVDVIISRPLTSGNLLLRLLFFPGGLHNTVAHLRHHVLCYCLYLFTSKLNTP